MAQKGLSGAKRDQEAAQEQTLGGPLLPEEDEEQDPTYEPESEHVLVPPDTAHVWNKMLNVLEGVAAICWKAGKPVRQRSCMPLFSALRHATTAARVKTCGE